MRIPKRFMQGGLPVIVEDVNTLVSKRGIIGEARYHEQKVLIDKTAAPPEITEQAFFHEKIHWALYMMSRDDLRNDEAFVDVLAHFLYQAEATAEYED